MPRPMNEATPRCVAITDSGVRCTNAAADGAAYCSMHDDRHSHQSARTNGAAHTVRSRSGQPTPEMELLEQEVEALFRELRARRLLHSTPEPSPAQLARLLNRAVGERLPAAPAALLADIERNLADATFADFADPEVLRGMALVTYYSLQAQAEPYREPVAAQLQRLPGYAFFSELRQNLSGATLHDFAHFGPWSVIWETASDGARLKLIELLRDYGEKHGAPSPPAS